MYQKISFTHICFIFSILVCVLFSSHTLFSQQVSPNAIIFGGMRITSEIPSGVHYYGEREIRQDLKIATEEWTKTLPDGTVKTGDKPPESEVYTYIVRAHGIGKLDLSLNDSGIPRDVGEFRATDVEPTPLTKHEEFYCYDRANCTVIRAYVGNYVAVYEDTCIPIANEGFKSEVMQGTEPLHAEASVVPWEIDIQYGTEEAIKNSLGFSGGWPPTVGVDAGWGETSTKKWGWKLREVLSKTKASKPGDENFPHFSGSFTVKIIDNEISNSKKPIPVTVCVTCPNCNGSVNTVDDHVKKVKPHGGEEGELVPATCPVEAITAAPGTTIVAGCGKKIYECTELEAALQEAWHQIRTCSNSSTFAPGQATRLGDDVCGKQFRHCKQSDCFFRYRIGKGHSDGTTSQAPANVINAYPNSHLIDDPPATTATLTSSDGSSTATAGSSFTVNVSLPTGYTLLYWYIKAPGESGYGTSVSSVSDSTGNSTTASYTYSLPSGASGDYVLTAYAYLSDSTIAEPSYTVSVSSGGTSAPTDNTPDCSLCTSGCSACDTDSDNTEAETTKICTRWKWKSVWDPVTNRYTSVYEQCGESFTDEFNYVGLCESNAAHEE
ncbi:MAG: hypothetical protein OXI43_03045 [Candidatus Poribacteria bacterium]|nr:hypothetical protein [Candidatus Poribacteria bacterium]